MSKIKVKKRYGLGHTKKYTKSIVCDFLASVSSDEDKVVQFRSDVNLILRQKNLHNTIGIDNLRNYLQNLDQGQPISHHFSDDELFDLIDPKGVNTITDAFEFSKYIEKHDAEIKERYNNLKRARYGSR